MPKDETTTTITSTTPSATTTITSIPRIPFSSTTPALLRAYLDSNTPFLLLLPDIDINDRDALNPSSSFFAHATNALVTPGEEDDFKDVSRLVSLFGGETRVPVVESKRRNEKGTEKSYGEEPRREMPLRDYARMWEEGVAEAEGLYLKDWHIIHALRRRREQEQKENDTQPQPSSSTSSSSPPSDPFYTVPPPLNDDWLNEWWDLPAGEANHPQREDDYRFLYLGPAGSVTPYHHDVLCSYSWSVNLAGIKEWTLYPPPASSLGAETDTLTPPSSLPPSSPHTHTHTTPPSPSPPILLTQHPNELLFVPSGWHHSVLNKTGCISINHNWFNGSSLARVWVFLSKEAHAVWRKLDDLKETFVDEESVSGWERQCECVLRANSAMNLTEWVDLLVGKAKRLRERIRREKGREGGEEEEEGTSSRASKDLAAILQVLEELVLPPYVNFLFPPHIPSSPSKGRDEEEVEVEEEGQRLPLAEVLLPQVQAWLREEIEQICESIEHL